MYESEDKIDKREIKVEVHLSDGTNVFGSVFLTQTQRLSDMLNDPRRFVPVRMLEGRVEHIHKDSILKAVETDLRVDLEEITNPYEILGVAKSIDDESLKARYHELCRRNHPDQLRSLDLAPEIEIYTNARLRRIIEAYREIMAARHGTPDDEEPIAEAA